MRKAWRVIGMAVTAGMLTASVAACGASSGGDAPANGLVLYSGQHEQTTQALVSAFENQTGIQVTVRNGDEDQLAEQIMQEGSRSPGDVFYTENSPALMKLAGQYLLAPVDKATLAAVPSADSSPAGNWVGVTARISALVAGSHIYPDNETLTSEVNSGQVEIGLINQY